MLLSDKEQKNYRRRHFAALCLDLSNALAELERLINHTPTSDLRNRMTDINIHVMTAQSLAVKLTKEI